MVVGKEESQSWSCDRCLITLCLGVGMCIVGVRCLGPLFTGHCNSHGSSISLSDRISETISCLVSLKILPSFLSVRSEILDSLIL